MLVLVQAGAGLAAAPGSERQAIPRATPAAVAQGLATPTGAYPADTTMQVNVGLAVRNPAQLDDLITAASTPGSPSYGRYLTQAEYLADFAPTDASVAAARAWLASTGLTVTNVSTDNLIIGVTGSASKIEGAFGVSIESFRVREPQLPCEHRQPDRPVQPEHLVGGWPERRRCHRGGPLE